MPSMRAPEIITLGCRLNGYESDVMRAHAIATGLGSAAIVNTCAVTAEAVRQGEQAIRRLKREDGARPIIVTGCAAEIEPDRFARMTEVAHVVPNGGKLERATFVALAAGEAPRVITASPAETSSVAAMPRGLAQSRTRALVQIQAGCDHNCTFCVIPQGRGRSRSKAPDAVVDEVEALVAAGHAEVVLTGVDITDYGRGLHETATLGRLVARILSEVPRLARLRLSSVDSIEVDEELLGLMGSEPRLMPHLHLSLQAGDDLTLKRMKRRHSRAEAIAFCEKVRALRPDVAFGADLIAGFPTETEEMFQGTLSLIEACGLAFVHVFPYSPRPGTPAARMPAVPPAIVKTRAKRLREAAALARGRHLERWIGREGAALMETSGETTSRGRLPDFTEVVVANGGMPPALTGVYRVRITGREATHLVGEAVA